MSEAHADQMMYLLAFVGLLFLVIVGVIALSQVKKNRLKSAENEPQNESQNESQPEPTLTLSPTQPQRNSEPEVTATLKIALRKTEENFFGRLRKAFSNADKKQVLEQVEEILYTSDLGPTTVQKLLEVVDSELTSKESSNLEAVKLALKKEMHRILQPIQSGVLESSQLVDLIRRPSQGPTVLMIVGVNGAGKTTSVGKMTAQLASQNFKVLVAAGDTFRAAAGGQLKTWTERAQNSMNAASTGFVEIYWPEHTTDPSAVAFDAVTRAKAHQFDFVLLDTAGRLHTQAPLMEELKKVKRVMAKVIPEAPHETWIVLDANSGQNALMQAKEFNQALGLTGVILTKMDGTAKGGVALGVVDQIQIPIKLVGIGEKINDLKSFEYQEYIQSILGD